MLRSRIIRSMVCAVVLAAATPPLASAEPVGGPQSGVFRVEPYSVNTHYICFQGGEPAHVLIEGDGDTDLDLYVYDEFGTLVASDDDLTDTCVAVWCPLWTGTFRIEVHNLGSVYNEYVLMAW